MNEQPTAPHTRQQGGSQARAPKCPPGAVGARAKAAQGPTCTRHIPVPTECVSDTDAYATWARRSVQPGAGVHTAPLPVHVGALRGARYTGDERKGGTHIGLPRKHGKGQARGRARAQGPPAAAAGRARGATAAGGWRQAGGGGVGEPVFRAVPWGNPTVLAPSSALAPHGLLCRAGKQRPEAAGSAKCVIPRPPACPGRTSPPQSAAPAQRHRPPCASQAALARNARWGD
jgi:hypothetical protein